jgi:hypothetical protein
MMKVFAALMASAALVASGLVHGVWTDRWQPPVDVARAAARLGELPLDVGSWKGRPLEVKPGTGGAGVAGCLQWHFEDRRTGTTLAVALVCGRPGPVSIHTPDACYVASGYTVGNLRRVRLPDDLGNFWKTDATRTTATDETRLRVYYGWHSAAGWTAPDDPRPAFAREHVLHKLYVVREIAGANESPREDPCEEFLRELLPRMGRAVLAGDS